MKKNDVFTFTGPNGDEVTAIVVDYVDESDYGSYGAETVYLCYAKNKLFLYEVGWYDPSDDYHYEEIHSYERFCRVVADNAILPEQDRILEDHLHLQDWINDYTDKEV